MAFQLQPGESIGPGVIRAAGKELKRAGRAVEKLSPGDAIHDVRKRLKRVRALARLVRESLGEKRFRRTNRLLRDVARPLAVLRDADVLVTALDKLRHASHARLGAAALDPIATALEQERDAAWPEILGDKHASTAIAVAIRQARRQVRKWEPAGRGWRIIGRGLTETYRAGQTSFAEATVDPSVELLHAWRKQVKYLWNQSEFLEPRRPRRLRSLAADLHALGDLLGDDHDLALLATKVLAKQRAWSAATDVTGRLLVAIRHRRQTLEEKATRLGRRIFAARAAEFVSRLKHGGRVRAAPSK